MNNDLYNEILQNGLGLNSPSIVLASNTLSTLSSANAAVDTLPIAVPPSGGVTQTLVDDTHRAINGASSVVTDSKSQMQSSLDSIIITINSAGSVNRIEDIDGCAYLTNATGSLMGDADEFLTGITNTAQAQIDAIAQYLAGSITTAQITQTLTDLNAAYKPFENSLKAILANELALAAQMLKKTQSSSLSKTIELLWTDPCANALLDRTLSAEIKDILNE